jgi:hypothetical protein
MRALISCTDCGKEYSRRAKSCVNCGAPNNIVEDIQHFKIYTLIVFLLLVVATYVVRKIDSTIVTCGANSIFAEGLGQGIGYAFGMALFGIPYLEFAPPEVLANLILSHERLGLPVFTIPCIVSEYNSSYLFICWLIMVMLVLYSGLLGIVSAFRK